MEIKRKENVSREDLYEQVWAAPMGQVAARYGISDVMMARACKRLHIPHPGRGYWAKLEVDKAPDRPRLPEAKPGEALEWVRDGRWAKTAPFPLPQAPDASAPLEKKKRISTKGRHHLVVDVEKDFLNTRNSDNGYLRPYKYSLPDITVSKERLVEGLDVASQVYRTFEAYGFRIEHVSRGYHRPPLGIDSQPVKRDPHVVESYSSRQATVALVGSLAIGLFVYEHCEEVPAEYDRATMGYVRTDTTTSAFRKKQLLGHYISMRALPSGRFGVWVYSPYKNVEWMQNFLEKQRGQLGGHLGKAIIRAVVAEAPSIAERYKVEHARQEEEARRAEERWKDYLAEEKAREQRELAEAHAKAEREAREHREALERQSRAELAGIIDDWFSRAKVATFIESVEATLGTLDKEQRGALEERLALAKELYAQRDPLARLLAWRTPEERQHGE